MNESLVRHTSKLHFSPSFIPSISCSPFSLSLPLSFPLLKHPSKLLIQGSSWWWSSFFHGLFPSGWRLLSLLLLCLPLHLHGGKSPLKDLIEAQRSILHRSPTSKLPSLATYSIYTCTWWITSSHHLGVKGSPHQHALIFMPSCIEIKSLGS